MMIRRPATVTLALLLLTGGCLGSADPEAPVGARDARSSDEPADLPRVAITPAFPRLHFTRPVFVTAAGDGTDRLFVVEQHGRIVVFENRSDVEGFDVFLDIRPKVRDRHNEEGLLSLAFHPQYAENGKLFVYYTASDPRRSVLASYRVSSDDPNRADPASEEVILEVEQPYGNHNGGTVLFGPDGLLYLSLGDGGWAADPKGHGQDLGTLLGSIIRIDVDRRDTGRAYAIPADNPFVDRPGARGEIWAYGLRNVWRMSFDRETGELWAADVGQNKWEEIDRIVRGGNYGWNRREGRHVFRSVDAPPADEPIDPIVEYGRDEGISVTGGYVYRGARNERLRGAYVYADYITGRVWALRADGDTMTSHREVLTSPDRKHISSFGEDAAGELFVCAFDRIDGKRGRVYRVVERSH